MTDARNMQGMGQLMQGRFSWERVAPMYQEAHRVYHDISHIHMMLRELNALDLSRDEREWMEAVVWLHDAYQDPLGGPPHNERRSADLLDGELGHAFTPLGRDLARAAILASAHHTRDQDDLHPLIAAFLDIDLAGLASEEREFNRQTRAVAEEFRRMGKSTEKICDAHASFCQKMLSRSRLYYLDRHANREDPARANLQRVAKDPLTFV